MANPAVLETATQTLPSVGIGFPSLPVNPIAAAKYEKASKATGSMGNSNKGKCVEYLYTANGVRGSCYQYSNTDY